MPLSIGIGTLSQRIAIGTLTSPLRTVRMSSRISLPPEVDGEPPVWRHAISAPMPVTLVVSACAAADPKTGCTRATSAFVDFTYSPRRRGMTATCAFRPKIGVERRAFAEIVRSRSRSGGSSSSDHGRSRGCYGSTRPAARGSGGHELAAELLPARTTQQTVRSQVPLQRY
jgi:hypothetical protein